MQLTPLKELGTVDEIFQLDCVYDQHARQKHIDSAVARGVPWCVKRAPRDGKIAIVASGPSAAECVDILKDWDGEIWGINGAFAWLLQRGIKATGFIGLDPEPMLKDYLINLPDVAYYLGSQVHPDVFDHLKDKNVRLWFPADSQVKFPFGAVPIYGGTTCLGRAPNLAYLLGWREAHIMGGDSSFTAKSHVYTDAGELPGGVFPIDFQGKTFLTTRQMLQQACDFTEQLVEWARPGTEGDEPLSVSIYGDGLMQYMFEKTLETGSYHQFLRETYANGMTPKEQKAVRKAMKRQAA
jgi:hypothetical protein